MRSSVRRCHLAINLHRPSGRRNCGNRWNATRANPFSNVQPERQVFRRSRAKLAWLNICPLQLLEARNPTSPFLPLPELRLARRDSCILQEVSRRCFVSASCTATVSPRPSAARHDRACSIRFHFKPVKHFLFAGYSRKCLPEICNYLAHLLLSGILHDVEKMLLSGAAARRLLLHALSFRQSRIQAA